jgi:type IV secretion system protein VirB10
MSPKNEDGHIEHGEEQISGIGENVRTVGGSTVAGERDIPSVNRERSLQSRANNLLALLVVALLGGGFLFYYYSATFSRQREAKAKVEADRTAKASGELKLPPLGAVEGPQATATDSGTPPDKGPTSLGDVMGPAPPLGAGGAAESGGPPVKTAAELAMERKLTPSVFLRSSEVAPANPSATGGALVPAMLTAGAPSSTGGGGAGQLDSYLTPSVTASTRAQVLATRRFVIPKGNFVDCTLETAINSELPGLATCITAFDIFGADGKVVLIERGSKLVGESRGQVAQGMKRVFILWSEARTPTGVVVQLASPGTDELGRSGVTGTVDSHFLARFGAAIMVSIIDGAVQTAVASQERTGSAVIVNPQGSQQIMDEVLRSTINIPPTININQGTRIQVIVARDVDFRSVYELRNTTSTP